MGNHHNLNYYFKIKIPVLGGSETLLCTLSSKSQFIIQKPMVRWTLMERWRDLPIMVTSCMPYHVILPVWAEESPTVVFYEM